MYKYNLHSLEPHRQINKQKSHTQDVYILSEIFTKFRHLF